MKVKDKIKSVKMVSELIHVDSPNVSYGGDKITVNYEYATTSVRKIENRIVVSEINSGGAILTTHTR